MYFLFQQLMTQNSLLYILNVCLHQDHNKHLLFYFKSSFAADFSMRKLLIIFNNVIVSQLTRFEQQIDYIRIMMFLSNETDKSCHVIVEHVHKLIKQFCHFLHLQHLHSYQNLAEFKSKDFESFSKSLETDVKLESKFISLKISIIHFCDSQILQDILDTQI